MNWNGRRVVSEWEPSNLLTLRLRTGREHGRLFKAALKTALMDDGRLDITVDGETFNFLEVVGISQWLAEWGGDAENEEDKPPPERISSNL